LFRFHESTGLSKISLPTPKHRPKKLRGASACPLLRHPEYYRNIRGRSRTFSKTRITFWEPPLPVSKTRPRFSAARPRPETRPEIPSQILVYQMRRAALRNGIPPRANPMTHHQHRHPENAPVFASPFQRKHLCHNPEEPFCETESAPIATHPAPRQDRPGFRFVMAP